MQQGKLETDQRAIVTHIDGDKDLKKYLLHAGITIGTILYMNYSPGYSGLVSVTVNGKMISLRKNDYDKIGWVKL